MRVKKAKLSYFSSFCSTSCRGIGKLLKFNSYLHIQLLTCSLVILDVVCRYLSLFLFLYINIKIGKIDVKC